MMYYNILVTALLFCSQLLPALADLGPCAEPCTTKYFACEKPAGEAYSSCVAGCPTSDIGDGKYLACRTICNVLRVASIDVCVGALYACQSASCGPVEPATQCSDCNALQSGSTYENCLYNAGLVTAQCGRDCESLGSSSARAGCDQICAGYQAAQNDACYAPIGACRAAECPPSGPSYPVPPPTPDLPVKPPPQADTATCLSYQAAVFACNTYSLLSPAIDVADSVCDPKSIAALSALALTLTAFPATAPAGVIIAENLIELVPACLYDKHLSPSAIGEAELDNYCDNHNTENQAFILNNGCSSSVIFKRTPLAYRRYAGRKRANCPLTLLPIPADIESQRKAVDACIGATGVDGFPSLCSDPSFGQISKVLAIAESLSKVRSDLGDQACDLSSSVQPSAVPRRR